MGLSECRGFLEVLYYSDIQKVEYEGGWFEGKRWGRGVQYDRNGNTVFDGEWYADNHGYPRKGRIEYVSDEAMISTVEELIVGHDCCNGEEWESLQLDSLPQLRKVSVCDFSFRKVHNVVFSGLNSLESVSIGRYCFQQLGGFIQLTPDTHFCVMDCPCLRELVIGCYSFTCYSECLIKNNPQLEVIAIGDYETPSRNFTYCALELKRTSA